MTATQVIAPDEGVRGNDMVSAVPIASRSRIPGEGGQLVAEVTSPHGKGHRIVFNRDYNVFEFSLLSDNRHTIYYRIDELLCVRTSRVKISGGVPYMPDAAAAETVSTLYFYFVYKKNAHKWRLKEIPVKFANPSERNYWAEIINSTLHRIRQRPQSLIVFINPFGGKGKAKKIFESDVEPFFKMAGIDYEVFMTQRANHAHDYILDEMPQEKWESIEGLVSVGGDGLFNELLSSAVKRTQREAGLDMESQDSARLAVPRMRFGIIGAGSANSIVSTVHETDDYATAAVHVAIGSECSVDVCTVHQDEHLVRISANAISYGWLGDVLRDSERYRWLGPIRYQWSALRTTARHPTYRGQVCFDVSSKETQDPRAHLPQCVKPCALCGTVAGESDESPTAEPSKYPYHLHGEFTHVICCVIPTITPFTPHGLAPFTGIGDGTLDLAMVPRISRCHNMRFMRRVAMYGGKGLQQLDSSLNCYRVTRWSYKPDADQPEPGVWNLDGELLEQPADKALHFRLHPQLITFFGRDAAGIEPAKRSTIRKKRKSSIVYQ